MPAVYRRPFQPQRIRKRRWVGTKVGGTTYTDSGSGTITLTGTSTSSQSHTGSGAGTITLSGTATASQSHSGTGTGTITLSGTSTRSSAYTDARSGTITLTGSGVENYVPPGPGASVFWHDPTPELSRVLLPA